MFSLCLSVHTWGNGTPVSGPSSLFNIWSHVLLGGGVPQPLVPCPFRGEGLPQPQDKILIFLKNKLVICFKWNECFRLTYFSDTILVVQCTCHSLYQITKVPVRVFLTCGTIYLQAIWCSIISINESKLNVDKNRIVWLNITRLKHFHLYLEWWSTAGPEYSQKQSCSHDIWSCSV